LGFEFVSSFEVVALRSIMQGTLSINQREILRNLSNEANELFFKE
jgi:hypothetical protein